MLSIISFVFLTLCCKSKHFYLFRKAISLIFGPKNQSDNAGAGAEGVSGAGHEGELLQCGGASFRWFSRISNCLLVSGLVLADFRTVLGMFLQQPRSFATAAL
jgi:hypothetical protein